MSNKIALCIGISDYDFVSPLKNPVNDATDVSDKLTAIGYDVTLLINVSRIELLRQIDNYNQKESSSDVSVIYYAGHGVQYNGINYIMPKDANPQNERELDYFCIGFDRLVSQEEVNDYKTNILIFDACRNNPFDRAWSRNTDFLGFSPILAPSGTLIAFSTSPGKTASDGEGRNGLYTESLLTELTKPDLSIIQIFQNVRQKVLFNSNHNQLPWESTSLLGDFFFNPKSFNPSDSKVIAVRKSVSKIKESLFLHDKKEVDIDDESSEGGTIIGYYKDGVIIKVEKILFFEMGRYFEDVFFEEGIPIYYRISSHRYNVPFHITPEVAKEINSDFFSEEKTKIKIQEYFFHDNLLIGVNKIEEKEVIDIDNTLNGEVLKSINELIKQCDN
ncbi:caspase family protein [Carboxylicivirga sp. RSCT41]|uniref:caspase family protein n=1 Tax=Carboxylicivirga agarovorans TaxID=3417570 RepID=UPI003D355096